MSPCCQGLKAHHKNEHVANRIVVASLTENMTLSPGGRRIHAQATQESDQVLLGALSSRHMSATIKAIRDMNFKKHAVLVSHVGKSCYVDAFHISSIVSWKVTQPGSMVCQKHAFKQRKNNSVLVFMFRPCCKSTLPKSHKLQVQRICWCWTPHISPWF